MKHYCDYDAIVHYKEGTFASKFADDMEGKLIRTERDEIEPWEVESFLDGKYDTYETREPIVMYRLYGKYQRDEGKLVGARLSGRFVSTEFAESVIDAKLRLALQPAWGNTKMYEAKLIVPAGIKVNVGIVAPVITRSGNVLPGGAPQIMLPKDWSEEWVQGYRRVSGRQLQVEPTYWPDQPEEIVEGKEKLYSDICPWCCYSKIRELQEGERFTIIGCKGREYTMKKMCLNPNCGYCW